jgi:O-succinylbenzoic acid--CoA ligase
MPSVSSKISSSFKFDGKAYNAASIKSLIAALNLQQEPYKLEIARFLSDWLNDLSYIEVQTSGSTGIPKTIRLKKAQMINSALATGAFF